MQKARTVGLAYIYIKTETHTFYDVLRHRSF